MFLDRTASEEEDADEVEDYEEEVEFYDGGVDAEGAAGGDEVTCLDEDEESTDFAEDADFVDEED